jgi:hypothetical protein
MIRNRLKILVFVAAATLLLSACGKKEHFDIGLIVGKWVAGTEYWRYDGDGNGATWDVGDDVNEDEAQPFTWEFDDEENLLTQIHQMEMGGVIPKSYTLKKLDENTLAYADRFDSTYTFKRVM